MKPYQSVSNKNQPSSRAIKMEQKGLNQYLSVHFFTPLSLCFFLLLQSKLNAKKLLESTDLFKLSLQQSEPVRILDNAQGATFSFIYNSDENKKDYFTDISTINDLTFQTQDYDIAYSFTEGIHPPTTEIHDELTPLINLILVAENTMLLRNAVLANKVPPSQGKMISMYFNDDLIQKEEVANSTDTHTINLLLLDHAEVNASLYNTPSNLTLTSNNKTSNDEKHLEEITHSLSTHQVTQILELKKGWNLTSFYVEAKDMDPDLVLASIKGDLLQIKSLAGIYDPSLPYFLNSIKQLNVTDGYWINMSKSTTLEITGIVQAKTEIEYHTGWNLMGYPKDKSTHIYNAIGTTEKGLIQNLVGIKNLKDSYNASLPPFMNTLENMTPGMGYWVNVTQNGVWHVGEDLPSIVINEVMSSNGNTVPDIYGNYYDFIEIYNNDDVAVDISNFGLTDNPDSPGKFTFPQGTHIGSKDFFLVYASKGKGLPDPNDTLKFEYWSGVSGNSFNSLVSFTNSSDYKNNIADEIQYINSFDSTNADGFSNNSKEDYAARVSGVFIATETGQYTFSLVSDDASVIVISADENRYDYQLTYAGKTNNDKMTVIARETSWTSTNNWSKIIGTHDLVEGKHYYIEGIYKEGNGGDHLQVGMVLPSENWKQYATKAIPGKYFQKREIEISKKFYYADFGIRNDDESITLTDKNDDIIDVMPPMLINSGLSYGSYPDGTEHRFFFETPTPNAPNPENGFLAVCEKPHWSIEGGVKNDSRIELAVTNFADLGGGHNVYFTVDCSSPTWDSTILNGSSANDTLNMIRCPDPRTEIINNPGDSKYFQSHTFKYDKPFIISRDTVIRSSVISDNSDCLSSNPITHTYVFNKETTLPIMSIVSDPLHLSDREEGIYVLGTNSPGNFPYWNTNIWEDWEKPASMEFFETDGELALRQDIGIKIFGGWMRAQPQTSLALFARGQYGQGEFDYQFFPEKGIDSFTSVVARNSGNDSQISGKGTMLRDGLMTGLMANTNLDLQAYRPVVVYLNGHYWGLMNLREKVNEDFFASNNPGVDPNRVDELEKNANVIEGSNVEYNEMIQFISNNSMKNNSNYQFVAERIDINNFINYEVSQIYLNNTDWPHNNIKFWRSQEEGGLWQWIEYDTDFGFGLNKHYTFDSLNWATRSNQWSTLLLRKLLDNAEFTDKFISHFCFLLSTRFEPAYVIDQIEDKMDVIRDEIPSHTKQWGGDKNDWLRNSQVLKIFANNRDDVIYSDLKNKFDLGGTSYLSFSHTDGGKIHAAGGIEIPYQLRAKYFNDIDIEVTAKANDGYIFKNWEWKNKNHSEEVITISLNSNQTLKAHFIKDPNAAKLSINEFMAANVNTIADPDLGLFSDWIEIYNDSSSSVNLTGYFLTDNKEVPHKWIFPTGSIIEPNEHLLIWADERGTENDGLHANFKLNQNGEFLGFYTPDGSQIDIIEYEIQNDDIAFGRTTDGVDDWEYLMPTPGGSNNHADIQDFDDIGL